MLNKPDRIHPYETVHLNIHEDTDTQAAGATSEQKMATTPNAVVNVGQHQISGDPVAEKGAKAKKYGSLIVLCVMNTSALLFIHYTRTREGFAQYHATTAVLFQEVFKVTMCLFIITAQERSPLRLFTILKENVLQQPWDCIKVSVPSFIYVVQNNLVFIALTNLDAATFQVLYQLRVITTALFSVTMLRRSLSKIQWFSLVTLFIGIAIVQIQMSEKTAKPNENAHMHKPLIGLICVVVSALLSGFAGVYFEKILKSTPLSVWVRNVQLGTIGIAIALVTVFAKDYASVKEKGFLVGYDGFVWGMILLQSISGLSVAAVIKYADNILKTFATAMAIVISCVVSYYLFEFHLTVAFVIGASIVITSGYMYSKFVYVPPN